MTADASNLDPPVTLRPVSDLEPCRICAHRQPHTAGIDNGECEAPGCSCFAGEWPPRLNDVDILAEMAGEVERLRAMLHRIRRIDPADHASSSRDFGRGFAEALRLVRAEMAT